MPPLSAYPLAADHALSAANTSRIFLQTATPRGVEVMETWAGERGVQLAYTDNERDLHDLWLKRDLNSSDCIGNWTGRLCQIQNGQRTSVVAQAVNALIASRARIFISPEASMWTYFVSALLRRRASDRVHSSHSAVDKRLRVVHRKSNAAATSDARSGRHQEIQRDGRGAKHRVDVERPLELQDAAGWTDF